VLHWAPIAAREAAARGAHRQATEHWLSALQHAGDATERARMLDACAVSAHWSGQMDRAIDARRDAARLWCEAGQPEAAAASLADQATLCMLSARRAQAQAALDEARSLVAARSDAPAARRVLGAAAWLRVADGDAAGAAALAEQVLSAARRAGDAGLVFDELKTLGGALMVLGRVNEGAEHLERGFAMALEQHDEGSAAQMLANLGTGYCNALQLTLAEDYSRRGIEFCGDRDLDAPRLFQTATLAHVLMLKGAWDEAAAAAQTVMSDPRATVIARIAALAVLGRLRARRGEEGAWALLDEARDLAAPAGAMRTIAPARARAEAAWIEGRHDDAAREVAPVAALAVAKQQAWLAAELLMWQRLTAADALPVPTFCANHPCALEATGRWREAAEAWRTCGCPFETARALMQGDESAQREALAALEALGAQPLAERVRQRLRAAGARGLPRGPRESTQQHPAGLTSREVAVLALLASGLRNKEIAQRLHRSPRTIDHHLQAVFAKLAVGSRLEAVSAARRLGVVDTLPARTPR
jgi:DNA-binding CsgD family transcriptional regulator